MAKLDINKTALWLWGFLAPTVLRGLMWVLSAWLGMESAKANETAQQLLTAGGAIFVAVIASLWSWWSKRKALSSPSPSQAETIAFLQRKLAEAHEKLDELK